MADHEVHLLCHYADRHMTYMEISAIMWKEHGVNLSDNAIRKKLKAAGAPSRRGPTRNSREEVKTAVQTLLSELPNTVGYRQMTDNLRQRNMHVRRDTVMQIMREVDPIGVGIRRTRRIDRRIYRSFGPNHTWHIDGYDKLKPYGFAIHGCIDGYSRKILWLKTGPSNNDPTIVAHNYVDCVKELQGCPMVLQSDPGTENANIGALQSLFRHRSSDCFADGSYRVSKSTFNQRIEAWWSMLRRQQSEWWISFFKDLEMFGGFHKGNENEIHSIRFCFMPLLQENLDCMKERWNDHRISHSRRAACPNGRPSVLYMLPEKDGFKDCLCRVSEDDIDFAYTTCQQASISGCKEFDSRARYIFNRSGWRTAETWEEALQQYFSIVEMNIFPM